MTSILNFLQTFFVENNSEKYGDTRSLEAANLYSIAQTYTDLKMYKNAVKYYKLEISLRDSKKEVGNVIITNLNIFELMR